MRYCIINCRNKSIVLIGMMGAGKSSVGRCLQLRTKLALVDIDDIVASHFGTSIPEIFSKYGEQVFREIETQALREMTPAKQTIIATGGGIVVGKENMHLLKQLGIVVWLDCNEETLFERAWRSGNRPLLRAENPREAFARMLQARLPLYAKIAQIRVDTSMLTDEEVAVAIVSKLRKLGRNWRPGSPIPPTR
ncbi:MAG: shikimate kinase [Verrucomicrobia bacterium]|nr:MAG: shikimate kinase [Verrucomicrobiota bacterium]